MPVIRTRGGKKKWVTPIAAQKSKKRAEYKKQVKIRNLKAQYQSMMTGGRPKISKGATP